MTIMFSSIYKYTCIAFMNKRPNQNLLLEKDIFTGRWNVLDAS